MTVFLERSVLPHMNEVLSSTQQQSGCVAWASESAGSSPSGRGPDRTNCLNLM